ncbi:MAG: tRNA (N6-isopentenyl adenosine(37)-C2)-methylthiotransferase MiaB [Chloroflexi bacterium]|nr:tRNA (N6-isopentenyl adenosine(37)-C2)-methylthiotransferase MiaB [Chloroflexota bacterium]MDA1173847.1 tRNA (N6-isopentenyl adenosine(37)-C2)-methylthiotransferase MiaB [Chloroflexota bacterium]
MRYYIWTEGCQMNMADSERMGSGLEQLGLELAPTAKEADVIVLNTCVVRQSAEDKAVGMLTSLKPWRQAKPERTLAVMGCMVGPQADALKKLYPYVDSFMQPQQFDSLINIVGEKLGIDPEGCVGALVPGHPSVTTHVPIIHGCDKFCTFCIIPFRRGRETSRPLEELVHECQMLVLRGVKEVTLLGQNVDSYGHDLPGAPDLGDLMEAIHERVPELARIRFLTSHPNDMSQHIIDTIARLPRVMENVNLPYQAGNDEVLERMRRGYTNAQYREIVGRVREAIPGVAMVTDLIVGFPGETEEQFEDSLTMVRDIRFDKVHVAAYSMRPNTFATRKMDDDVPLEEKKRRLKAIEQAQEAVLTEINNTYFGTVQEILVDRRKAGRWQGRTRTDKLVFFDPPDDSGRDMIGEMVNIRITKTTPWSLQGKLVATPVVAS